MSFRHVVARVERDGGGTTTQTLCGEPHRPGTDVAPKIAVRMTEEEIEEWDVCRACVARAKENERG